MAGFMASAPIIISSDSDDDLREAKRLSLMELHTLKKVGQSSKVTFIFQ